MLFIFLGPHESSSSSSSSSSSDSDVETGKHVKLKHDYKSKLENWKQATVCTISPNMMLSSMLAFS